jgi:Kelch motif protein
MGVRGVGLLAITALAGCSFPRPADVGPGGDGGPGDGTQTGDGASGSDGSTGTPALGPFAIFGGGLLHGRSFHAHGVFNNKVSVFSGVDDSATAPTSIEQAAIGANDNLGAFQFNNNPVADPATGQGLVVLGNVVFLIGGESGTSLNATDQIQEAAINASGTLGTFSFATPTLVTSHDGNGAVLTSKFVYVIGGERFVSGSGTTYLATVERSSITTGTLGSFSQVSGVALGTGRGQHSIVQTASFVYVIGGTNGSSSALTSVERAAINADGTLGTFTTLSSHLVKGRLSHAAVVLDNAIYVIGGRDANLNALDSVERAVINGDGTLGPFATLTVKLKTARYGLSADVIGSSIYVVGGQTDVSGVLATVERAIYQ